MWCSRDEGRRRAKSICKSTDTEFLCQLKSTILLSAFILQTRRITCSPRVEAEKRGKTEFIRFLHSRAPWPGSPTGTPLCSQPRVHAVRLVLSGFPTGCARVLMTLPVQSRVASTTVDLSRSRLCFTNTITSKSTPLAVTPRPLGPSYLSDPPKYHRGFREQVEKWPVHPLDIIIEWLGKYPKARVADFGCGEARLAATVPNKVCHATLQGGGVGGTAFFFAVSGRRQKRVTTNNTSGVRAAEDKQAKQLPISFTLPFKLAWMRPEQSFFSGVGSTSSHRM